MTLWIWIKISLIFLAVVFKLKNMQKFSDFAFYDNFRNSWHWKWLILPHQFFVIVTKKPCTPIPVYVLTLTLSFSLNFDLLYIALYWYMNWKSSTDFIENVLCKVLSFPRRFICWFSFLQIWLGSEQNWIVCW